MANFNNLFEAALVNCGLALPATAVVSSSPSGSTPTPVLSSSGADLTILSPEAQSNLLAQAMARSSPRRSRCEKRPIPESLKDDKYFERRKRNNLAAKKSRDQRKNREETVKQRADQLEKENAVLRAQVSTLRDEMTSLHTLLLQKRLNQQRKRDEQLIQAVLAKKMKGDQ